MWKAAFQIIAIALALLGGRAASGQDNLRLSGQVFDADTGAPLPAVWVQVEGTHWQATTDESGYFALENLPAGGYAVRFSRLGYLDHRMSNIAITTGAVQHLTVMLTPQPLPLSAVTVTATRESDARDVEGDRVVLEREAIARFASLGLGTVLQQVAGVQVESSGGGASRSVIRIHGSQASQVLVLLDGQKMNHPQTGEVDLNDIPLSQVEKIEVIRQGNAAVFGGGAFAGVISFHTRRTVREHFAAIRAEGGSFQSAAGGAMAGLALGKFSIRSHMQQDYSRQNFAFERENQRFRRENAWYRHRSVFLKGQYQTARHQVSGFYQERWGRGGLPSAFYEEMNHFNAEKEERSRAVHFRHRWFFHPRSFGEGVISVNEVEQLFDNTADPSPFTRYRVQQKNRVIEPKIQFTFVMHPRLEGRLGLQYLAETLDHRNLLFPQLSIGRKTRDSRAVFGSGTLTLPVVPSVWRSARIQAALRYETYFDTPARWYPYLGVSLTPTPLPEVSLAASVARAVRYPDFNSLFWKGDARARGNPDLRPERKSLWNLGARWRPRSPFLPALGISYYSENLRDLIFWHRAVNGIWEPRNEDRARKQGWNLSAEQAILPGIVRLQTAYSFVDAVNQSDQPNRSGKQIVFTPKHTLNISLGAGAGAFQTLLTYRRVSERQITPANTGAALPPYAVWDASAAYQFTHKDWSAKTGLAVKNITGTHYELIRGFPMPGREWQLQLTLRYGTE